MGMVESIFMDAARMPKATAILINAFALIDVANDLIDPFAASRTPDIFSTASPRFSKRPVIASDGV